MLVCTSGTAAAHYLPALVEASLANVPLIAITADRPPELQHCGASQTIDQVKMYGSAVRAAFDVGVQVQLFGRRPAMAREHLQRFQGQRVRQPRAPLREQLFEQARHREHRGAGVLVPSRDLARVQLAPGAFMRLQKQYVATGRGQAGGRDQAADACPHHDDRRRCAILQFGSTHS